MPFQQAVELARVRLRAKQADGSYSSSPEGGGNTGTGQPAPMYGPSQDPNHVCDNCAFNDSTQQYCKKFDFKNDPFAVCQEWQTEDLDLSKIKFGAALGGQRNALPSMTPLKAIPTVDGGKPGGSQARPPAQGMPAQLPPNIRRPSVVAQIGREQGGPNAVLANIRDMFNAPPQQQVPQMGMKRSNWGAGALIGGAGGLGLGALGQYLMANHAGGRIPGTEIAVPALGANSSTIGNLAGSTAAGAGIGALTGGALSENTPKTRRRRPSTAKDIEMALEKDSNLGALATGLGTNFVAGMGPDYLQNLFSPKPKRKPLVQMPSQGLSETPVKAGTVHSIGDPLPLDWNKHLVEPTKKNGGITSHGREAWDSVNGYKPSSSRYGNFDRSWHTKKADKPMKRVKKAQTPPMPLPRQLAGQQANPQPLPRQMQAPSAPMPMQMQAPQAPSMPMQMQAPPALMRGVPSTPAPMRGTPAPSSRATGRVAGRAMKSANDHALLALRFALDRASKRI